MSEIKVNSISSLNGANGPVISGIATMVSSGAMTLPRGDTAYRGSRGRGVVGGGVDDGVGVLNTMQYITIASTGDATDFGDLSYTVHSMNACASSTRGLFGSGFRGTTPLNVGDNTINYISIQSTGNAFDFGDLNRQFGQGFALSNNTRGIFGGGYFQPAPIIYTTIDYVTIASTGNASVFGDISTDARASASRSAASSTRGIISGGYSPSRAAVQNIIEYITISTLGDAQDFGDLSAARRKHAYASNSTRALAGGGETPGNTNLIDYITIASLGDAIDFGDLSVARHDGAATASQTRGIFAGGDPQTDTIDYVTISSIGNATDFGNLLGTTDRNCALSDSHGGLG